MKLRMMSKDILKHEELLAKKNCRIYISGKISGLSDLNVLKFSKTENWLHFLFGTDTSIVNPHTLLHLHNKSWENYMKEDLRHLLACNIVVVLDDWMISRGAVIEVLLANAVKMPIYFIDDKGELQAIKITFGMKFLLGFKLLLNRF